MGTVIEAIYDGESFRPLRKVKLPKGTKVKVLIGETIWDMMNEIEGIEVKVNIGDVFEDVRGRKRVRY
ncbi:antitoxin family protein [Thermococcus sp.]|uniref:antitoxin family protein n=1 Tax=Thermococcus sp. TaxID=35749 RepID=UPI00260620A3|nr:antitoxin family protein [Thermococcus sp.]